MIPPTETCGRRAPRLSFEEPSTGLARRASAAELIGPVSSFSFRCGCREARPVGACGCRRPLAGIQGACGRACRLRVHSSGSLHRPQRWRWEEAVSERSDDGRTRLPRRGLPPVAGVPQVWTRSVASILGHSGEPLVAGPLGPVPCSRFDRRLELGRRLGVADGRSLEVHAVCVVEEAVADGVSEVGIPNGGVPVL